MIVRDENKNEYILEKVAGTGGQGAVVYNKDVSIENIYHSTPR